MTDREMYHRLTHLPHRNDRDVVDWLVALHDLVEGHKGQTPTPELMLHLLDAAFVAPTRSLPEEWRAVRQPYNPWISVQEGEEDPPADAAAELALTINTLQWMAAELEGMRGNLLDDPLNGFGVRSASGAKWHNFSPASLVEVGAQSLLSHGNEEEMDADWGLIGVLLDTGREGE